MRLSLASCVLFTVTTALVAVVACSSSQAPVVRRSGSEMPGAAEVGSPGDADSGTVTAANGLVEPGCPASFAEAEGAACVMHTRCTWPEGQCDCAHPPQCGGAYRAYSMTESGGLTCLSNDPAAARADGCPYTLPAHATPCSLDARVCNYGPCSWNIQRAQCVGGLWNVTVQMGPPPP